MEPIKQKEIDRCIRSLSVLGCQFKVITPDGNQYGELEVVPAKAPTPRNNFKQYGYRQLIEALDPGEVLSLKPPEGVSLGKWQSVVTSAAHSLLGSKNYLTSRSTAGIEVLCLANPKKEQTDAVTAD